MIIMRVMMIINIVMIYSEDPSRNTKKKKKDLAE